MKVITVPAEETFLFDLLDSARDEGLILQTVGGQQFVLWPLDEWIGFPVGDSDDFAEEVWATGENQDLLDFLAERRSRGERVPLADVKKRLGLS